MREFVSEPPIYRFIHKSVRERNKTRDATSQQEMLETSNTPLMAHLLIREFVSRPPIYRSIHKRVRDRNMTRDATSQQEML